MGLFDVLVSQADDLAAKVGISPDQVQSIASAIQEKVASNPDQLAALEQVAKDHGLPVDTIQALLGHAGGGTDDAAASGGGLLGQLGGLAGGLFSKA